MIDFTRLCERTEVLSELDPWRIWQVVRTFRSHCLTAFARGPDGDIDPAPAEARAALGEVDKMRWAMAGGSENWQYVPKQVALLLRTPRVLKQALRRTWQAWEVLHGEVDFDDLLIANVLRAGVPRGYDRLLAESNRIRALPMPGAQDTRSADDLDRERQTLLSVIGPAPGRAAAAAQTLSFFLFPMWYRRFVPDRPAAAQGVAVSHPTDYWVRVNAEAVDEDGRTPTDQLVLRLIRDAKSNADRRGPLLAKLGEDSAFADKFEQFASRELTDVVNLGSDDLRALATLLFARLLDRYGAAADADAAPGYFALWRSLLEKPSGRNHRTWLQGEIRKALGVSLHFADELFYYWASPRAGLLGHDERKLVLRDMLKAAKVEFAGNAQRLLSVLDPSDPASIYRLAFPPDGPPADPAVWAWLAPVVLEATETNLALGLPQLGYLLQDSELQWVRRPGEARSDVQTQYRLSEERMNLIFSDARQKEHALRVLARSTPAIESDPQTVRMITALRGEAEARITRGGRPQP